MNQTLQDFYESLPPQNSPKSDFLQKVMSECGVSFTTAMNWVKNKVRPSSAEYLDKLSSLTGIPKESLFR